MTEFTVQTRKDSDSSALMENQAMYTSLFSSQAKAVKAQFGY